MRFPENRLVGLVRDPDVQEGVESENHRAVVPVVVTSFHGSGVLCWGKVRTTHGSDRLFGQEVTTVLSSLIPGNGEDIPGKRFLSWKILLAVIVDDYND